MCCCSMYLLHPCVQASNRCQKLRFEIAHVILHDYMETGLEGSGLFSLN